MQRVFRRHEETLNIIDDMRDVGLPDHLTPALTQMLMQEAHRWEILALENAGIDRDEWNSYVDSLTDVKEK